MSIATAATTSQTQRSVELARISFAVGVIFLFVFVLGLCRQQRQGNQYVVFGTLWASGHAAANGLNPYAVYPETFRTDMSQKGGERFPDLNLNPPWTIPFTQVLAYLPITRFMQTWTIMTGVCLLSGCLILLSARPEMLGRQILWLLFSFPVLSTLVSGQVYGWPFLLGTLAWLFHRQERYVAAGLAVGVAVATRPTMALWIVFLYLAGHRKVATSSVLTVTALYAMPLMIYGPSIYKEWFQAIAGDNHWINPLNIAIMPTLARYGFPRTGIAIAILVVVFFIWWVYKNKPDFTTVSGIATCLGIICAPLAWFHYVLFVAPFFMAKKWTTLAGIAALLLLIFLPPVVLGVLDLLAVVLILIFFVHGEWAIETQSAVPAD